MAGPDPNKEGVTRRKLIGIAAGAVPVGAVGIAAQAQDAAAVAQPAAPWLKAELITPKQFGARSDGASDSGAALNAFFAAAAVDPSFKYCASGDWATASPLLLDGGEFGIGSHELDFGNCRISALAPVPRLLTIQDSAAGKFSGRLHLRGTGFMSDGHRSWTCDVGLYCNNVVGSKFDQLVLEAFGYAGVESERQPSANDGVHWGRIQAKRVGSGAPLVERSLVARWSGASNVGPSASVIQYSEIDVDTLPLVYARGSKAGPPDRQILVEIDGRLHFVKHVDPGSGRLRVYPWLRPSIGRSGRLVYHYGGALVLNGVDSNIDTFEQISCIAGSTALELSCLYGPSGGIVHSEACGSNMRVGGTPASIMWGAFIGQRYCEGNRFNYVQVTTAASQVFIGASPATHPPAKDVDVSAPLTGAGSSERYMSEGLLGLTMGGPEGWHFKRKRYVGIAEEKLDFGNPRLFDHPVFYTGTTGSASFTLAAPPPALREQFALDCCEITVMGPGPKGEPTAAVKFVPPSGHRINNGAASAPAQFSGFDGVARFAIYYDGERGWVVH